MGSITAADGARLAHDDRGAGAPLVLVHGITESRAAWDPIVDRLAARWRVIRVDARGHGESDRVPPYDAVTLAEDLAVVVRELDLDPPLLVGHSMGGVVVSAYGGLGHPARGIVDVDQPLELASFKAALEPIRPMLEGDDESFRTAVALVFELLDGPLPPEERARLDALSSPERDVVLGVWGTVFDHSADELDAMVSELLRGISVPFLAVHGSDPGAAYVEWLLARVAHAQVEVWPDTGHYPHLVDPDRFVERLDRFDAGR